MRWDVCGVRITRVVEFVMPFPVDFFAEATPADVAAEAWLVPDFVNADGYYLMRYVVHRRHPPDRGLDSTAVKCAFPQIRRV